MARQRMLERCGWTFWRVRGSTFYRNPEAALEKLWSALDQLRIYPTSREGGPRNSTNAEQTGFHRAGPSPEEFEDISSRRDEGVKDEISGDHQKSKNSDKPNFSESEAKNKPIDQDKKIRNVPV